jgi:hypothetical protein
MGGMTAVLGCGVSTHLTLLTDGFAGDVEVLGAKSGCLLDVTFPSRRSDCDMTVRAVLGVNATTGTFCFGVLGGVTLTSFR